MTKEQADAWALQDSEWLKTEEGKAYIAAATRASVYEAAWAAATESVAPLFDAKR